MGALRNPQDSRYLRVKTTLSWSDPVLSDMVRRAREDVFHA
jgi:hypothetical protein